MDDDLKIEPIPPEPFPDGKVEMRADGLTSYRLMTREEFAAIFGQYNADRRDA